MNNGIESRLEEADLASLYGQGKLKADTPCRRMGSPTWFRLDELFPKYGNSATGHTYHTQLAPGSSTSRLKSTLLTAFMALVIGFLLVIAVHRICYP